MRMREGETRTAKNGMKYKKINGRVRIIAGATGGSRRRKKTRRPKRSRALFGQGVPPQMSPIGALDDISDLVGVSLGDLGRIMRSATNCITAVTPEGVKTLCKKAASGVRRKKRTRR